MRRYKRAGLGKLRDAKMCVGHISHPGPLPKTALKKNLEAPAINDREVDGGKK